MTQNNSLERLSFDLRGLAEYRGTRTDILNEGDVEHTGETLQLLRSVYGQGQQTELDSIETKLKNTGPNRPRLHAETLASVLALLRLSKATSVLDIGCGEGLLLRALVNEPQVETVVGLEMSESHIKAARVLTGESAKVQFIHEEPTGSTSTTYPEVDAITLVEVVEHVDNPRWIDMVLALGSALVIATTPNRDFNVLYPPNDLQANGLRHPGHVFEFSREEFTDWAHTHADARGYTANLLPIGPADLEHGSSGQMAVFQRD